jgi:uncharacterized protein YqgV (UPF0045/DUF77 family)
MFSTQHREDLHNSHSLANQLQESRALLQSQSLTLQQQASERAALQTQIVHLNDQLVTMQRKVENVEGDNRRLLQVSVK